MSENSLIRKLKYKLKIKNILGLGLLLLVILLSDRVLEGDWPFAFLEGDGEDIVYDKKKK